jgi:1-acyl-sn-glycerol-3-phosphate acyltransferase
VARPASQLAHTLSFLRSLLILNNLIYLYTVVLGTLSLLSSLFDSSGRTQHWFARTWSWLILKTAMCPVTVTGLDRIDTTKPHMYALNHLSALDIPVVYVHLPFQFRIVAKEELFHYPFMGWHLRRSGQVAINRANALASMRSLNRAAESLKGGMPLVVFPEGGRSKSGQTLPFLSGVFYVAIKAQVDVVPAALVGSYEALPMDTFHIQPRPMGLVVGDPIPTNGLTPRDMDALAARVQRAVEDLYYQRAEVADPRKAPAETQSAVAAATPEEASTARTPAD